MSHGINKCGAVIFGDMILESKLVWSQVAAGLRSPFRQKGPASAKTGGQPKSLEEAKEAFFVFGFMAYTNGCSQCDLQRISRFRDGRC